MIRYNKTEVDFNSLTSPPLRYTKETCKGGFFKPRIIKIAVFIDGGNLYRRLKEIDIKSTNKFNYAKFINYLSDGIKPKYVGYYVGQIRYNENNLKSINLHINQQKLFRHLKISVANIKIIRGQIINLHGIYKEKGVDVKLALDIYRLANENIYDKAILISSDSDLIPAVELVQKNGKTVEYIGFKTTPSFALIKTCKSAKLLTYDSIKQFEAQENLL